MQACLVGIALAGLWDRNVRVALNAVFALLITQLPAILERNFRITLDVGLTLWVTAAVFLHALGLVPFGLFGGTAYTRVWWWDHLTHTLSSTVVAAVGYTAARVMEAQSEYNTFPSRFLFVYLLLFVMAAGVVWELVEYCIGVGSIVLGIDPVLTQFGLQDTLLDLVFNTLGAVLVAAGGTAYLSGLIDQLTDRLMSRRAD